jgi:hypothetical protein
MFERDWQRACAKEKFTSMLARENKGNAAGKSDKQALQEVHDMLKRHYQVGQHGIMCWRRAIMLQRGVMRTPGTRHRHACMWMFG